MFDALKAEVASEGYLIRQCNAFLAALDVSCALSVQRVWVCASSGRLLCVMIMAVMNSVVSGD